MASTAHKLKPLDYAVYTWPQTHGEEPVMVQILEVRSYGCLVRLCSNLKVKGDRTVKAGRLHLCGTDWLRPVESPHASADVVKQGE